MSQDLSATSYALLGLLVFDGTAGEGLTGYELKQRADKTLRFYWVSPAMSQVYTELERLTRLRLVTGTAGQSGRRTTQRYRITDEGSERLQRWLRSSDVDFPVLKHPVALRLLMGGLMPPQQVRSLLQGYLDQLAERRASLVEVRAGLGEAERVRYPAMVADWGLSYYDSEATLVRDLMQRLGEGYNWTMTTSDSTPDEDYDQDSEATMMAPEEGRPDGVEDTSVAEKQGGVHSPEADDQSGAEQPG